MPILREPEGTSRHITLHEVGPDVVNRMIRWLYAHEYDDSLTATENSSIQGTGPELLVNAHMYTLGDRYGVNGLKHLAIEKFKTAMDGQMLERKVSNHSTSCLNKAVATIYTTMPSSDRGLCDAVLQGLRKRKDELVDDEVFLGLLSSGLAEGQFLEEVLRSWMTCSNDRCPSNRFVWQCEGCADDSLETRMIRCKCNTYFSGFKID